MRKVPVVTEVTVPSRRLPASFSGCRIAHVSDLHNAEFGVRNEKLLDVLQGCAPDLIAITGDLIDSRRTNTDVAVDFGKRAVKIAPVYYVPGNHESRLERFEETELLLRLAGVEELRDRNVILHRGSDAVCLAGLADPSFSFAVEQQQGKRYLEHMECRLESLMERNMYTILLSHRPELFPVYCRQNVDLALCGHAHGGQIRLPMLGGIIAPHQGFFPTYTEGLYQRKGCCMVVSRGLGNSLFPLRINNPPEVVVITVEKGKK